MIRNNKLDGIKISFSDACAIEVLFLDQYFFRIGSETCEADEAYGPTGGYIVINPDEINALIHALELVKVMTREQIG